MSIEERAGFSTYWRQMGRGPRSAVAIHCSLAHSGAWRGLSKALGDMLTLTAFDLPGHGRSGDWGPDDGEVQTLSTRIAETFVTTPPVDIIGHSFGATVALRLAMERPDLVRSLVLYEPVFFAAALQKDAQMRQAHLLEMTPYQTAWDAGALEQAAEGFLKIWGDGTPWEKLSAQSRADMTRRIHLINAAAGALYDDTGNLLAEGRLEAMDRPTLLINGANSPDITYAINRGLAERLPNAETVTLKGLDHMGVVTRADVVAPPVRAFLSRV